MEQRVREGEVGAWRRVHGGGYGVRDEGAEVMEGGGVASDQLNLSQLWFAGCSL